MAKQFLQALNVIGKKLQSVQVLVLVLYLTINTQQTTTRYAPMIK